jgi:hypothetical protein
MTVDSSLTTVPARAVARIGGVLYLIIIALGVFQEMFVRSRMIVPADAAQTAANIASMEWLWRLGIAAELLLLSCATALTVVFLVLLGPVSRLLTWLAVFFNLIAIAIEGAASLSLVEALFPLGKAGYLQAFEPSQLHALARLDTRSHAHGFGIALIFFGWCAVIVGILIYRSGFLPRVLGVLMGIAGICYLVNSFALIVVPAVAARLFPAILLPAFVAETSLALWLLLKGVKPAHI